MHSKSPPRSLDKVLPNENVAMIVENYFPLEKCQDLYEFLGGEEEGVADLVFSRDRYNMFAKCAVDKWDTPRVCVKSRMPLRIKRSVDQRLTNPKLATNPMTNENGPKENTNRHNGCDKISSNNTLADEPTSPMLASKRSCLLSTFYFASTKLCKSYCHKIYAAAW